MMNSTTLHYERICSHSCNRTGRTWDIKSPMNCLTDNVIYKLLCRKCPDFFYIGETKRRLCDRVQEHRISITKKKTDHPVGAHFNQEGVRHHVTDLIAVAIERVLPKNNTFLRKQREHLWIDRTDATTFGSNKRD